SGRRVVIRGSRRLVVIQGGGRRVVIRGSGRRVVVRGRWRLPAIRRSRRWVVLRGRRRFRTTRGSGRRVAVRGWWQLRALRGWGQFRRQACCGHLPHLPRNEANLLYRCYRPGLTKVPHPRKDSNKFLIRRLEAESARKRDPRTRELGVPRACLWSGRPGRAQAEGGAELGTYMTLVGRAYP